MIYPKLEFNIPKNRPFFFSNLVMTIDGKVQVLGNKSKEYWPIGSRTDHDTLMDLRKASDILLHGRNTALGFKHIENTRSAYIVVTAHPDDTLTEVLENKLGLKAYLATTNQAKIPETLLPWVNVIRLGDDQVDLGSLSKWLFEQGFKKVLVEGGPNLIGEFLQAKLLDEIFVTVAPKIFGNLPSQTLSLVEGFLFASGEVPVFKLRKVHQVGDELFLRYER